MKFLKICLTFESKSIQSTTLEKKDFYEFELSETFNT